MEITVTTFHGFEPFLTEELKQLGATDITPGIRAVTCFGDKNLLYRANYELRTALRVLVPIHTFTSHHPDHLYTQVRKFNFSGYLTSDQSFAIDTVVHSESFKHGQYVTHRIKDAIADQFKSKYGVRPSVNVTNPDFRLNVRISKEQVTLSSDSSGESLHKRGYKTKTVDAPISEVLAAGIIKATKWDGSKPFIDPMAGSGTIAIEAAMFAGKVPAQYCRPNFQFMKWRNFDKYQWTKIKNEANSQINTDIVPIFASDKDIKAIEAIRTNQSLLPVNGKVIASQFDFFNVARHDAVIVFNPPYDERLKMQDIAMFYEKIGSHLKHKCAGSQAWIISSNLEAIKSIGLKPFKKFNFYNGPLETKLLGFELFEGGKKSAS